MPSFDRSNVDGLAVRAEDTFGASEEKPRALRWMGETLSPGQCEVPGGFAVILEFVQPVVLLLEADATDPGTTGNAIGSFPLLLNTALQNDFKGPPASGPFLW